MKSLNLTHVIGAPFNRLIALEYAIRLSMTVREDQEEAALPEHLQEAAACGVPVTKDMDKADLLCAVQTLCRAQSHPLNETGAVDANGCSDERSDEQDAL